jgi:putative flavoprotein involved in K+ transport
MYAARDRLEVVVVGGGQSGLAMRGIRRRGVELHPRAVAAEGSTVTFTDGGTLDVAAVIWATGYRSDYSWLDVPVFDERGVPVHRRGVTESPGLYFLGLTWQYTRGSALLGWVKDDAEYLAQRIDELNLAPPEQSSESPGGDAGSNYL